MTTILHYLLLPFLDFRRLIWEREQERRSRVRLDILSHTRYN